jgi:hypothetical protein
MTHRAHCPLPSRAVDAWTRHLRSRYTQGDGLDYSACGRVTIAFLPLANGALRWSPRYLWRRGSSKSLSWRSGATRQDAVAIARRDELSKGAWPHVDGPAALRQLLPDTTHVHENLVETAAVGCLCLHTIEHRRCEDSNISLSGYKQYSRSSETCLWPAPVGAANKIMSSKNHETDDRSASSGPSATAN